MDRAGPRWSIAAILALSRTSTVWPCQAQSLNTVDTQRIPNPWKDAKMDGWMDGWVAGQIDRQKDRWIDREMMDWKAGKYVGERDQIWTPSLQSVKALLAHSRVPLLHQFWQEQGKQLPINFVLNTKFHLQRNYKKPFSESDPQPSLFCSATEPGPCLRRTPQQHGAEPQIPTLIRKR